MAKPQTVDRYLAGLNAQKRAALARVRRYILAAAPRAEECFSSYSFTPDVAAGLVALGTQTNARGVWMLPVQPAETTRTVVGRFASALGREIAIAPVPTWLLRSMGLFQPMLREIAEMTYQWKQPYVVDDAKFRATFGFGATPWDDAVAETVRWARATYGTNGRRIVQPERAVA